MAGFNKSNQFGRPTLSEINVTPLVDVMLVLLIVFMVSAPLMQQGIDVQLPKVNAESLPQSDNPIVISIKKNGHISWDGKSVSMDQFKKRISASSLKDTQILVQADTAVPYGTVAAVMAAIRSANIRKVGLVTAPMDHSP